MQPNKMSNAPSEQLPQKLTRINFKIQRRKRLPRRDFAFCPLRKYNYSPNYVVKNLRSSTKIRVIETFICNLTLPEYLISTPLNPRWTPRHTHRPRKRKVDPKLPLLLSPVVRLITPLVILSGSTAPPPLIPFNSNFSELDGRRLARLFCFFLNFSYIFAEYSDSYIVNICGILIFKIAIIQRRIRLSQFLWEFVFLISIRVNFCVTVLCGFYRFTG